VKLLYYLLIETSRCIESLALKDLKESQVARLLVQTYYGTSRSGIKIYILNELQFTTKNFGTKSKYTLNKSWYTQLRNDVKITIRNSNIVR